MSILVSHFTVGRCLNQNMPRNPEGRPSPTNQCRFRAFHGLWGYPVEGEVQIYNSLEERRLQRRPSKYNTKCHGTHVAEIPDFASKPLAYCYATDFQKMSAREHKNSSRHTFEAVKSERRP